MNRNPRWSIGMIALLLATFAYTSQVSAQSTYLPQYESFDEYQSFDGGVATAPQFNPATTYSPDSYLPPTTYSPPATYSPPTTNLYGSQSQTLNSNWMPQSPTANIYNTLGPTSYPSRSYPQKTIANPFSFHPNTAQTPACQGGS